MEVILAQKAGYCFGVKRAVDMVEDCINDATMPVYTYGPIIHNEEVVKAFEKRGVRVLDTYEDIKAAEPGRVIIRAHGVPAADYDFIKSCGHTIVDATCPFVLKIHNIVKGASENGDLIVIIGNPEHPEVEGIRSCAKPENTAVLNSREDVEAFVKAHPDKNLKICIVAQTTFNHNKFQEFVEIFSKNGYNFVRVLNTICNATEERQAEAESMSRRVDAVIVIGGKGSSNTRKLYDICSSICPDTYLIQTADDMDFTRLRGVKKVGITAGASTPEYIIREVQTKCQI